MTAIKDDLATAVADALRGLGIDPPDPVPIERPAHADHGDWSSSVALAVAKAAGRNPRELGQQLVDVLNAAPPAHVSAVEIAGPGFVNFRLADSWLHDVLNQVIDEGVDGYAAPDLGQGMRVNIEFVSANPTGPLHIGNGRWASYGDALWQLFNRCGYQADREYYLNDRGLQMQLFADSLAARKAGQELPEDGYQGAYIHEWAAEMPDDADPFEWGYQRVRDNMAGSLAAMGVEFERWFSERSLVDSGAIEATLDDLRGHGVVYEAEGAVWLRSTDFGDDKDRVLVRSDGEYTYVLPDIAYHRDKFARGYELLIDVWGADHHGYVTRLRAGMQALGHQPDELEIILGQLVTLKRGGEEVRIGKRSGTAIWLDELLEEVGADSARLTFLLQSMDSRQTFDIDVVTSTANDNPVFYVQYANARIHSIGRRAAERSITRAALSEVDLSVLSHPRELEILRVLFALQELMPAACVERAPHRIANWARELASAFHGFYHDCHVLSDDVDEPTRQARLWLVEAALIGITIAADVLGVSLPDRMEREEP
jgi:arginyl-tRNA synthetase